MFYKHVTTCTESLHHTTFLPTLFFEAVLWHGNPATAWTEALNLIEQGS